MVQPRNYAAFVGLFVVILVSSVAESGFAGTKEREPMLVSTSWLQEHLNDPSVIIFHVAPNRREYKYGHIPGARFLWTNALQYSDPDLTLELPSLAQADSTLESLGVRNGVRIILCFDGAAVTPTTRVFFTFEYLGLGDRVSLLDGGLDAWKAEGRPMTTEMPEIQKGTFKPTAQSNVVVTCDEVRKDLDDPNVAIVDARGEQFYEGKGGGMPRAGHIPGAINIPFSNLVDSTNKMKSPAELKAIFQRAGVKPGSRIIAYCHIGQQASLVYFAAKYIGYSVQLYDGSFEEWSGRNDLPIDNPAQKKSGK